MDTAAITFDLPLVYVDRAAFVANNISPEAILTAFITALRAVPGVARVDKVSTLAKGDSVRDAVTRRWMHMVPLDSPVEYVLTPVEHAYPAEARIAEHGTPYDDDAHVPVMFYGPWFKPGRYQTRALVADMAPTLAHVIGVPPTENVDGRVLIQALVSRAHP